MARLVQSLYISALNGLPVGQLPTRDQPVEIPECAEPVPLGRFLSRLRDGGIAKQNAGQEIRDSLERHGQYLQQHPTKPNNWQLPPTGKRLVWPQSFYISALNGLPVGQLPTRDQPVEIPECAEPVPLGRFLSRLRDGGIAKQNAGQEIRDSLERHGQYLQQHPTKPNNWQLPPTGKRLVWPQSFYISALNGLPVGQLPTRDQLVEIPECAEPVPLGRFLSRLRDGGIAKQNAGQEIRDSLERHGQYLQQHPTKPNNWQLPSTGKPIVWPQSFYISALNGLPVGQLPTRDQLVKIPECAEPVPLGRFLSRLRDGGIAKQNAGQEIRDSLERHGQYLQQHPTKPNKWKLITGADIIPTHFAAAMTSYHQRGHTTRKYSPQPTSIDQASKRARIM
ncbi:hypothetical protein [Micromonospora sp. SH-82]|uniref:hypothetical protein n=1 Tax=Micromonospora sp. SH-82 TaxID=3132938 RepID=UPI003EBCE3AB